MPALSPSAVVHLEGMANFYDKAPPLNWASREYRKALAHYYNLLIPPQANVLEIGCGAGDLLGLLKVRSRTGLDVSPKQIERARDQVLDENFFVRAGEDLNLDEQFDYIVISDTINFAADVQRMFDRLRQVSHAKTRLILNFHNALWRPLLAAATWGKLKARQPHSNWLAGSDVRTLLELADWEVITMTPRIIFPVKFFGLEIILNRYLAPFLPFLCLACFVSRAPAPLAKREK